MGGPRFALGYDVSDAHRQWPVVEEDWGLLACQTRGTAAEAVRAGLAAEAEKADEREPRIEDEDSGLPVEARKKRRAELKPRNAVFTDEQLKETIWYNMVGTFGVSGAGCWWGRGGALLIRLAHYLAPRVLAIWLLLFADDGLGSGQGSQFDRALMLHLYILEVLGTPLKWKKVRGGNASRVDWLPA